MKRLMDVGEAREPLRVSPANQKEPKWFYTVGSSACICAMHFLTGTKPLAPCPEGDVKPSAPDVVTTSMTTAVSSSPPAPSQREGLKV
ncbi:hypothetical protein EVAR_84031_1 [Eumeta japonica]|uniref:Uncharacterized protein n=1 Tax=Eumeta variegata TaxID=151549 RepID=A0A4C1X519_EUMVA|nr:hypothetical protein EVAR_84031_1 [Eumeta japonica]